MNDIRPGSRLSRIMALDVFLKLTPVVLRIPGFDKPLVMNAKKALLGKPTGKNIEIIDATNGCLTAEWILNAGKSVKIGDAQGIGSILEAVRNGYVAGKSI
ncbi:hypothetical protein [Holdemania filiformis]|uniref:hypothetical protein n=1 Tax=Holdemania filiformis TaxID=61171 RepID=UPI0026746C58|nr:hypothetical protein [Holdemania filiformis]